MRMDWNRRGLALWMALMIIGVSGVAVAGGYPSVSTAVEAERTGEKDVAIIVGVESYPWLPDIDGVMETVRDWENFFEGSLGVATVHRLVESQATRERVERFVRQAGESVDPEGTLWFVFVGHGAPDPELGDGLLVGVDAQPQLESLQARSLRRSELVAALEEGLQRRTVVIVDACFSGQTARGESLIPGAQPVLPTRMVPRVQRETLILSAAGAGEIAGPLPDLNRPAFSYFLLGAFRGWAANEEGEVSGRAALHYTRGKLGMIQERQQTPEAIGDSELVLVRGVQEADPLPNWRGLSPMAVEAMQLDGERRRKEALEARRVAEEAARAEQEEAAKGEVLEHYQEQRLFESEERFYQGSWANSLEWPTFYETIGRPDLAEEYRPTNNWGILGSLLAGGGLGVGLGYLLAHRNYDPEQGGSLTSQAGSYLAMTVTPGLTLGWYLGAAIFQERQPLNAQERRGAAREFNERLARELGVPAHLTISPTVGETIGLNLQIQY